jgi:hypothetical protein
MTKTADHEGVLHNGIEVTQSKRSSGDRNRASPGAKLVGYVGEMGFLSSDLAATRWSECGIRLSGPSESLGTETDRRWSRQRLDSQSEMPEGT